MLFCQDWIHGLQQIMLFPGFQDDRWAFFPRYGSKFRACILGSNGVLKLTLDGQIESGGAWVGTPDEIKAIIKRVSGTIGKFEHASLQVNFGTLDFREAQKSIRLFAAEVMPAFAEAVQSARQPEPAAQGR